MRTLIPLVLGLLALVVFLFLKPGAESEVPSLPAGDPETVESLQTHAEGAAALEPGILDRSATEPLVSQDGVDLEALAADPEVRSLHQLQILDKETEQPIAGAEVWTFASRRFFPMNAEQAEFLQQFPDPEQQARHFSETFVSDEKGLVTVPLYRGGQTLVARAGERFGFKSHVGTRDRFVHLELDRSTSILVRDPRGRCRHPRRSGFRLRGSPHQRAVRRPGPRLR